MSFANTIADVAETQDHDPDIEISWGKSIIKIWTYIRVCPSNCVNFSKVI